MTNHWICAGLTAAGLALAGCHGAEPKGEPAAAITEMKLETLAKAPLAFTDVADVTMSRVDVPAGKTLPLHYHPGQEFIYVIAGTGTLHLRDGDDVPLETGDHFMVPYKVVHTFTAGPTGARAVVVRVHQVGEPERVLVEDKK